MNNKSLFLSIPAHSIPGPGLLLVQLLNFSSKEYLHLSILCRWSLAVVSKDQSHGQVLNAQDDRCTQP